MPAVVMLLLIAVVGVASLLFNSGCWLWMSAKWCRIPNVTYWRALATVALMGVIDLCLQAARFVLGAETKGMLLLWLLYAVVATVCIRQVIRTTTRRALAAGLITMVLSGIAALPLVIPLKLFVMESFAVPTGAMATAIIGRHCDVTCERCGLSYPVSAVERYDIQQRTRGGGRSPFAIRRKGTQQFSRCPNCRTERALPDELPIASGDKILVDKLGSPRRWDVVVFQNPAEVSVNYVMRLVGLPGETVEIIAGDIFINERRETKPFGVAHDLWIPLNDTRFRPKDLTPDDPQWEPVPSGAHWSWDQKGWTFSGAEVESEELVFSGPTTDESSYAERWSGDPSWPSESPLETGDLQVTCTLTRFSGTGPLGFHWAFRGQSLTASITGSGEVDLRSDQGRQQAQLKQPLSAVKQLTFAFRDGVATLIADGQMLAMLAVGPQDAETCRNFEVDTTEPCRIAITADHCNVELARIVLERDVYYRSIDTTPCNGCLGNPLTLAAQEYYVLGDHSLRANDSRLWDTVDDSLEGRFQIGTVPSELMIGVARCIYWPAERWRTLR